MAAVPRGRLLTRHPALVAPYTVVHSIGSAGELHDRPFPEPPAAEIWINEVIRPAAVLGSAQDDTVLDRAACERAGFDIVRRRSGGGVVFLLPETSHWIDVIVPRGAPGWSDDVHRSMIWLGEHLAHLLRAALRAHGQRSVVAVHDGPFRASRWSGVLCFDGIGAGEITLDGAKLVGISQRRTRAGARLQCSWYTAYDQGSVLGLLAARGRPQPGDPGDPVDPAEVATLPTAVARSFAHAVERELGARLAAPAGS